MGIETPTPIQRLAIQAVLDGRDVIAKAETGTGKTLAFGAPMMSKIDPARSTVLGLALCPTRELAQQVAKVLEQLGEPNGIKVALIVGGEPMHEQINALKAGAQVVVGTPGRVLDLYGQGFLSFPWTEFVVLDEADEMLEIGFIDDVKKILSFTPEERQTLHFSATFPHDVLALARESTRDPVEIATAAGVSTVDTIAQAFVELSEDDRPRALRRILERSGEDDIFLVFCDRRTEVDQLFRTIERSRIPVKALHGGYDQASRFRVMSAFREGNVKALLATDVASRGLDVDHVTHVLNYSVPKGIEDYTHRIGRTGRAGRQGNSLTFVTPDKARRWREIVAKAPWDVPRLELSDLGRGSGGSRGRDDDRGGRGGRGRAERDGGDERPRRRSRGDRERSERERPADRDRERDRDRDEGRPPRGRTAERDSAGRDERPRRGPRAADRDRGESDRGRGRREDRSESPERGRSGGDERPRSRRDRPAEDAPRRRGSRGGERSRSEPEDKPLTERPGGEPVRERRPGQRRDSGPRRPRGDGRRSGGGGETARSSSGDSSRNRSDRPARSRSESTRSGRQDRDERPCDDRPRSRRPDRDDRPTPSERSSEAAPRGRREPAKDDGGGFGEGI